MPKGGSLEYCDEKVMPKDELKLKAIKKYFEGKFINQKESFFTIVDLSKKKSLDMEILTKSNERFIFSIRLKT